VRIPETLLAQIFTNLIGNAIRYADKEGIPIEVGGERRGTLVRYYVRDRGPGVPEEERERIFDVFFRGAMQREVPGTGVGLATVQKVARLYGGRAWVEETEGGGSTFWVEVEDATDHEGKSP
jgi:signal transduction histidine kinase